MRVSNETIDRLCGQYDIRELDSIEKLLIVCRYKYNDEWSVMEKIVNNPIAMEEFCDRESEEGFGAHFERG